MYRRKLRGTHELVMAGFYHFNRGLPNTEFHNARVRQDEVEPLVRAVLETGRRRGRAEFALELAELLGIGRALEVELKLPPMTVAPLMREEPKPAIVAHAIDVPDSEVPVHVPRELAGQVVIPPPEISRRSGRKP